MPEYVNPLLEQGKELNELAGRIFDEGTASRHHADDYIRRTTVVLATTCSCLGLSSGSGIRRVRFGVLSWPPGC